MKQGNLLQADAEALVNTVNCVGVMGRGIALQFRRAFPEQYREYQAACERKELRPGIVLVHELNRIHGPRYIIDFPTKRHWKGKSRIEDIKAGLVALVAQVQQLSIRSIALPPLGCGLGGLDWREVRPLIETAFAALPDVRVLLYEPLAEPAPETVLAAQAPPKMTVGRAALLGLIRRYLAGVMDPSVSLLELHKLMYFMQEAGESLKLRYQKAIYGPYAENLRHVLQHIEGHYIKGYGDPEDRPDKPIELLPEAAEQAEDFLRDHPATRAHFERVVNLINGFESTFGLELLATVHWVATREHAASADEAIAHTYGWNERKQMFQPAHIRVAWDVLESQGWLGAPHAN